MKKVLLLAGIAVIATSGLVCYSILKKDKETKEQKEEWEEIIRRATKETQDDISTSTKDTTI